MPQEYPFHLLLSFMAERANAGNVKKWCQSFLTVARDPKALASAKRSMDSMWTEGYCEELRKAFDEGFSEEYRREVIRQGMAKLTKEEKDAMGLSAFKFEE